MGWGCHQEALLWKQVGKLLKENQKRTGQESAGITSLMQLIFHSE